VFNLCSYRSHPDCNWLYDENEELSAAFSRRRVPRENYPLADRSENCMETTCPTCGVVFGPEDGVWQCPDCGHAPPHGAD